MKLDFDAVDNVADSNKIDNGVWMQFYNPDSTSEEPTFAGLHVGPDGFLFLDEACKAPVRALVRSHRCSAIRDAEERSNRDGVVRIRMAKRKERNKAIGESGIVPMDERFAYVLVALENISRKVPGRQDVSFDDAKAIYKEPKRGWMVEQINETAYDDLRFAAGEETPLGNGSSSTSSSVTTVTPTTTDQPTLGA